MVAEGPLRDSAATTGLFTATINVTSGGDLELHVFTLVGNTLVQLGQTTQTVRGAATLSVSVGAAAGSALFVEVKGLNSAPRVQDQGQYNMIVKLG